MTSLGFENYAEALKIYLTKYREVCEAPSRFKHPFPSTLVKPQQVTTSPDVVGHRADNKTRHNQRVATTLRDQAVVTAHPAARPLSPALLLRATPQDTHSNQTLQTTVYSPLNSATPTRPQIRMVQCTQAKLTMVAVRQAISFRRNALILSTF